MPDPSSDQWDDPGFKQWSHNEGRRGGGTATPGNGPGGGYGLFFGMAGQAPANTGLAGVRQTRRRIGFNPMVGPSTPSGPVADPSAMTSLRQGASGGRTSLSPMGGPSAAPDWGQGTAQPAAASTPMPSTSALTPAQQAQIAAAPMWRRFALAAQFAQQNQATNAAGTQYAAGTTPGGGSWNDPSTWDAWGNNHDGGWGGIQANLLARGFAGGAFNPMGSPELIAMQRSRVLEDAGAREAKARTAAALSGGGDPSMRGVAELLASLGTSSDAARAGSDAALSTAQSGQDFARSLMADYLGSNQGAYSSSWANRNGQQQQQGNPFLNWLGEAGGRWAGGLI